MKKRWYKIIFLTSFVLFFSYIRCPAIETHMKELIKKKNIHITSDYMEYDEDKKRFLAKGDVKISIDGYTIETDMVIYDQSKGEIRILRGFLCEKEGDQIMGGRAIFNINTMEGKIEDGKFLLKGSDFYLSGSIIEKTGPDSYMIKDCKITTCAGDRPDWSFSAKKIELTIEGYGKAKGATFWIRDLPLLYIPYAVFPVKIKRQSGILFPRFGISDRNGIETEIPIFWAIRANMDATFYERYMTDRGLMQGMEFRYLLENSSKGAFLFDILSDRVEEKRIYDEMDMALSPYDRTNRVRYWLRGKVDQYIAENTKLRADLDILSDQDYLREFNTSLFGNDPREDLDLSFNRYSYDLLNEFRRSALRLSYDNQDLFCIHMGSSYLQRPESPSPETTTQPLYETALHIPLRPFSILPDLDYSLIAKAQYNWERDGEKGERILLSPKFSYPILSFPYIELEPFLEFNILNDWYSDESGKRDEELGSSFRLGLNSGIHLQRIYGEGYRHKISPSIRYKVGDYHREGGNTWYDPLREDNNIHCISLLIRQTLDHKLKNRYHQIATLWLEQGYNLNHDETEFLPLSIILTLNTSKYVSLYSKTLYDHDTDRVKWAFTSIDISLPQIEADLRYHYRREESKDLSLDLTIEPLSGISAGMNIRKELYWDEDLSSSYFIRYESQCWAVQISWSKLDDAKSVMFNFDLRGLGSIL